MTNPFLRRATEFIRDDSTFLSIVSPEPLNAFVAKHPKKGALLDVPVRVIGSPGSGKTMMASLIEFRLVEAVLRDQSSESSRILAAALEACGFTDDRSRPTVAAVRLPMESEYRDFWELPYEPAVKTKLVASLIQARAVLGLLRNICAGKRRRLADIRFATREGAEAQLERIGGADPSAVRERAREVEKAVYGIGAGLLPPSLGDIPSEARDPYQPFEAIREIEIDWDGEVLRLRPLVILDDVHTLHPEQFDALLRVLARREMRIGRWMMMRMDVLSPNAVFRSADDDALPGLKRDRDYFDIFMQGQSFMQGHAKRGGERKHFRKMAVDMADRYLRLVQTLRDRSVSQFGHLLGAEPPKLPAGKLDELRRLTEREQKRLGVAPSRRAAIERMVSMYARGSKSVDVGEDVQLSMVRVLMSRYAVRVAKQTPALFDIEDPEPKMRLKADVSVADAARFQLHERFGRPFHYGMDDLCDASNENAELFLQLAGALVARAETRVIRGLDLALAPEQQQRALRAKAEEMIDEWKFPFAQKVRGLVDHLAADCLEVSALPNARLGAGANAIAVPEAEMDGFLKDGGELVLVLKSALAYGVIVPVRHYGQGGKDWCLFELSGPVCLRHGLTLKRGGFLERRVVDLVAIVDQLQG